MKRKIHTLNGKAWGKIGSVCAVFGVAATVWAASQADYVSAATVQFQLDASSETLEMEIDSSSIVLDLTPSSSGRFGSEDFNITVGTSSQYGYSLKMVTDPTLNGALKRTEALNNGNTPTIAAITSTSGGYTQAEIEASSALTNMWGYKCTTCVKNGVDASTNYLPVPTTSTDIATTNTNGNANTTTLTFGAKIDNNTPAGVYGTTIVFAAIVNTPEGSQYSSINQLEYMQDFAGLDPDELTAVKNSMVTGTQYTLKDRRDEKAYYIAKLADGNVWMTQNLDHNIVATADFYTYNNTDIGHGATKDTSATWTGVATTSGTSWTSSASTPVSYDPGNLCWDGTLDNATTNCIDGSNMNYHIGNYYNWTAAIAMTNSSSITSGSVDQSICPAGWTLPKGGSNTGSGSFQGLVTPYGWNDDDYTLSSTYKMWDAPLYFPLGDYWDGGSWGVGSDGYYWSSTVNDASDAYGLLFRYDDNVYLDYYSGRRVGFSVRCVAR